MSKAVLVLPEMPENCRSCPLADFEVTCFPIEHEIANADIRPDWCPLRPMPEQRAEKCVISETDEWDNFIAKGWNNCIWVLEGGKEKEQEKFF